MSVVLAEKFVSFNSLGNFGRLGNSMFQYATVLGSARKTGHTPTCNISGIPLFEECFELGSVVDKISEPNLILNEQGFEYQEALHHLPIDASVDLRGYFQSEKYFKHCENEIRQDFTFKQKIKDIAINKVPTEVSVSVHVRRGDYVNLQDYHYNQSKEYYNEALEKFPDHRPVFFSDDIEWCKDNFKNIKNNPVFVENEESLNLSSAHNSDLSGYVDMCAMSFCNAHIIANSSFSWWGAWLGKGKTIAPSNWFGPKEAWKNHKDVYCDGWEVI